MSSPRYSVIVPAHNSAGLLELCLASIRAADFENYEIIVSDDGSADGSLIRAVGEKFGATVLRSEQCRGAAAARNLGANAASGEYLIFFDSDVTLHRDTLRRMAAALDATPRPDAVFGCYDREPAEPAPVSRFRNLLHAHVHERSLPTATTFWTGCGAVRRTSFYEVGGFDQAYDRPSIEDVELGMRLTKAGRPIILDSSIKAKHHKLWTLKSMIRTDIFQRAVPWTALLRDHSLPNDLNFRGNDRAAAALTALLIPVTIAAIRHPVHWEVPLLLLALILAMQINTLRFFRECGGAAFALTCVPLLLIYNVVCVVGLVLGLLTMERRRDRWFLPGLALCGAALIALQVGTGAYRAEFDAHPDEAAHYVSSLATYDFLARLPAANALQWARDYYKHYPKIAIGHWPPGYYLLQFLWWLVFPVSRTFTLLLGAFMVLASATLFHRMIAWTSPKWVAWIATILLLSASVTQRTLDTVMAESLCLFLAVLFFDVTARIVTRPSPMKLKVAGLIVVCSLLTKVTGVALIPALLVALAISGAWRFYGVSALAKWVALVGALGGAWFAGAWALEQTGVMSAADTAKVDWQVLFVPAMAGWGLVGLAVAGGIVALVDRRPIAVTAFSMVAAAVGASLFIRMNEPRLWITILPPMLVLAAEFAMWVRRRYAPLALLCLLPLVTLPVKPMIQTPSHFREYARTVKRPARLLVSGDASAEGGVIATFAATEYRPGSTVMRASKLLAQSTWTGRSYGLLTPTAEHIASIVDRNQIDHILIQNRPGIQYPDHHRLLNEMVATTPGWSKCWSAGLLTEWCRQNTGARNMR